MKITAITGQLKRQNRYSIYIDDKYSFSLSEAALLDSHLVKDQELNPQEVRQLKSLSQSDKLLNLTLYYASLRLHSRWEVERYLERKKASPALTKSILNKLSNINMINDKTFAEALISDRQLLRPTSRRKMIAQLRQKHVSEEIINEVVTQDSEAEQTALLSVIERKRRQSKYQDDQKLMQYLARQGFNYQDIKSALKT